MLRERTVKKNVTHRSYYESKRRKNTQKSLYNLTPSKVWVLHHLMPTVYVILRCSVLEPEARALYVMSAKHKSIASVLIWKRKKMLIMFNSNTSSFLSIATVASRGECSLAYPYAITVCVIISTSQDGRKCQEM